MRVETKITIELSGKEYDHVKEVIDILAEEEKSPSFRKLLNAAQIETIKKLNETINA